TINSTTAGLFTANADVVATVAGTFNPVTGIHRDTDPATAAIGPGPNGSSFAQKQYVDARIKIAPLNATNAAGPNGSHTFTVTVEYDDGLPAGAPGGDATTGFAPANNVPVTTSIANSNGATSSMTGGTCGTPGPLTGSGNTNAAGQCTIVINGPTAGVVTANA